MYKAIDGLLIGLVSIDMVMDGMGLIFDLSLWLLTNTASHEMIYLRLRNSVIGQATLSSKWTQ